MPENQFVIDPKNYRLDRRLLTGLRLAFLVWLPMTLLVTFLCLEDIDAFITVWLIVAYLGAFGITYQLLIAKRRNILFVEDNALVLIGLRWIPGGRVVIPRSKLIALELDRDGDGDKRSYVRLCLIYRFLRWQRRIYLAYLVDTKGKHQIFRQMRDFLALHGYKSVITKQANHPGRLCCWFYNTTDIASHSDA